MNISDVEAEDKWSTQLFVMFKNSFFIESRDHTKIGNKNLYLKNSIMCPKTSQMHKTNL